MKILIIKFALLPFQQIMMFGLVLTGFYYFMFYDNGQVQKTKLQQIESQIVTEEARKVQSEKALKELADIRATVGTLGEQFHSVQKELPVDIQMADIIREVDKLSQASAVEIKSKEPKDNVDHGYYTEIPLKISLDGTYSNIVMFLSYVANTERLMKAKNIIISPIGDSGAVGKGKKGLLQFQGEIVSYKFVETKAPDTKAPQEIKQ